MIFNCPGSQKFKQPQAEAIKCPNCGAEAEIWTDEAETTCPACKKKVSRNTGQCCLDWCKHAKECVVEEKLDRYTKNKNRKGE